MSIKLSSKLEPIVLNYAKSNRITEEEAVDQLIHAGLKSKTSRVKRKSGEPNKLSTIGAFSSDEDAALIDEVMVFVRDLRESATLTDFGV